jgi:hypothetical protein
MQLHNVLLLVVALPVTAWQPLNRAAGKRTHPQVRRSWPDARQKKLYKTINFIDVYIHSTPLHRIYYKLFIGPVET